MPFVLKKEKKNPFLSQKCTLKVPVAVGRECVFLHQPTFGALKHRLASRGQKHGEVRLWSQPSHAVPKSFRSIPSLQTG